jgi:predicted outer membrane repeat protein
MRGTLMLTRYAALLLLLAPSLSSASTLCVNPGGSGGCFPAIQLAVNAAHRGDLIQVAAGTYAEHVVIGAKSALQIQGAGAGSTFVDGGGSGTVLTANGPSTAVLISEITLQNGTRGVEVGGHVRFTLEDSAVVGNVGGAGIGVVAHSTVAVTRCTVAGNSSTGSGGGIGAAGSVTVTASTISDNSADDSGGGIFDDDGSLKVIDSTVSGNSAGFSGGGIRSRIVTITGSTISGNHAQMSGGGIAARPFTAIRAKISNSTISGNSAGDLAGGILVVSGTQLDHVTIANNNAGSAGGGIATSTFQTKPVKLTASLIADNTAGVGNNCHHLAIRGISGNLIEGPLDACTITNVGGAILLSGDPLLGPLQNNGGPTATQALGAGSPAIGALTKLSACRVPDQRGVARSVPCDLGAYEAP